MRRRRWWLLGLVLLGAAVVSVFWLAGPDPLHTQFRRIQLGMTIEECGDALKQATWPRKRLHTSHVYSGEEFPESGRPSPLTLSEREEALSYYLNSGEILVVFKDRRVIYKKSIRYVPNAWNLLGEFIDRVRWIVHL